MASHCGGRAQGKASAGDKWASAEQSRLEAGHREYLQQLSFTSKHTKCEACGQKEVSLKRKHSCSLTMYNMGRWIWDSGMTCMLIASFIQALAALCVKATGGRVPIFEIVVSAHPVNKSLFSSLYSFLYSTSALSIVSPYGALAHRLYEVAFVQLPP